MHIKRVILGFSMGVAVAALSACASAPATAPASTPPANTSSSAAPPDGTLTEADTASAMEKRFQNAARSYKQVQKDGKTLYCKRERVIGSTIPTMNCLSEAQLRNQVENMEEYRNRARNSSRCTHGVGCSGGS